MQKRKLYAVVLSLLVAASLLENGNHFVKADEISDAKSAIQSNQDQSDSLSKQLQAQQNKVADLNNAVANKTLAIQKSQKKIKDNQDKLTQLKKAVAKTQKQVQSRRQSIKRQLVALQKSSSKSTLGNAYADFIFSGDDFSDMVTRALAVQKINNANQAAIAALKGSEDMLTSLKQEHQNKQTELVADKQQLEKERVQLDSDKLAASNQQTALEQQLTNTQSQSAGLQSQLKSAQDKQSAIEAALKAAEAEQKQQAQQAADDKKQADAAKNSVAANNTNSTDTTGSGDDIDAATKATDAPALQQALAANLPSSAANNKIIQDAMKYLGVPYVWGGTSPSGFDCSGLVYYCYALEGKSIPRVSQDQSTVGQYINLSDIQPGDLLFWGGVGTAHHVAIYIGDGEYIHAPEPGENVKIGTIAWFTPDFARRIPL